MRRFGRACGDFRQRPGFCQEISPLWPVPERLGEAGSGLAVRGLRGSHGCDECTPQGAGFVAK